MKIRHSLFSIICILGSYSSAAFELPFPGPNTEPEVKEFDNILTANIHGAISVRQVFMDDVLLTTTYQFRATSGGIVSVKTKQNDTSWRHIQGPDFNFLVTRTSDTTIRWYNYNNNTSEYFELDPNDSDSVVNDFTIANSEAPWFIDYINFNSLEQSTRSSAKSFERLLIKTGNGGATPIACSDMPDCDGWVLLDLFASSIIGGVVCAESFGLLCGGAAINFTRALDGYNEECGDCSPYAEPRDSNQVTIAVTEETCTAIECGNAAGLGSGVPQLIYRCTEWTDFYTDGVLTDTWCSRYEYSRP